MDEQQLDLDEIQGIVLRDRPMPYVGAYLLFQVDDAQDGREFLRRLLPHVTSAADWQHPSHKTWLNVVATHHGLAQLGLPASILDGFPEEFRISMRERQDALGDVGDSDPSHWDMVAKGSRFDLGLLLMAPDEATFAATTAIGEAALDGLPGIQRAGGIESRTPANHREHFGYVDGISRPFIEGQGGTPEPGQGEPARAGEFILGYVDELGQLATGPGPDALWRNGSYVSIRKLQQNVAQFRSWLRNNAANADEQELLAAKLVGRWRSGCPLALSPDNDDASIAQDPAQVNDFTFHDDPVGRHTPPGCHIRRVNPRDALQDTMVDVRIHRLLRRGSSYGPPLPAGVLDDDGVDRGVVLTFVNAHPGRQFEFVQSQWVNDGDFISAGRERDPVAGHHEPGNNDYRYPARPVRRHLQGLPAFVVTKGGEHTFLPSLTGLRWLADGG